MLRHTMSVRVQNDSGEESMPEKRATNREVALSNESRYPRMHETKSTLSTRATTSLVLSSRAITLDVTKHPLSTEGVDTGQE